MLSIVADSRNKKAYVSLRSIEANTEYGIDRFLWFLGRELKSTASKQVLAKPRSGRVYRYKGRRHVASSRGESPANRSGAYRKSIGFNVRGHTMEFGAGAKYSAYLENGTRRMAARPGLLNSIKSNEKTGLDRANSELKKALT